MPKVLQLTGRILLINTVADKSNLTVPDLTSNAPLAGKTVLLVEDETFIADLLVSWFGRLGAKTLWANNGEEGVRLLAANTQDVCVVVADFKLPDMDGTDMCIRLRKLKPGVPVLLSSGRYQREAEEFLSRSGPTCFLQKPYPLEEVLVKLKKLLG
jgi:DNA-binding response OmpR family regulator